MPRQPRMTVCSNCLEDFPDKEMYTVGKASSWGSTEIGYYTPFCKDCTMNDKESYLKIIEEPKPPKKRKTKKSETNKKN